MFVYFDAETRGTLPLRTRGKVKGVGSVRYAWHEDTRELVWAWSVGGGPVRTWSPEDVWTGPNDDLEELYAAIRDGATFVAHNAIFDFCIWNRFRPVKIPFEQIICTQAQAEASVLPGGLGKVIQALKIPFKKDPRGEGLIRELCDGTKAWPNDPEKMQAFREYGASDVPPLPEILKRTRPFTGQEWAAYQDTLRQNLRGIGVDEGWCHTAIALDREYKAPLEVRVARVLGRKNAHSKCHKLKQEKLTEWLAGDPEMLKIVNVYDKKRKKWKVSCGDYERNKLLAALPESKLPPSTQARLRHFIGLLNEVAGTSAEKFKKMAVMSHEGRLYGQIAFSGAGQTGRAAGRGINLQNVSRKVLRPWPLVGDSPEDCAIERLMDEPTQEMLLGMAHHTGTKSPQDLLTRLIRPALVAKDGHTFLAVDSRQIEKRVTAWLAGPPGEAMLNVFREGRDPYKVAAMAIYGKKYDEITKADRTVGKPAALALDFAGGVGAFQAMAPTYGVEVSDVEAKKIVESYRAANPWLVAFWHQLETAAYSALRNPGKVFTAGRMRYIFIPQLMHGTLAAILPNGDWMVYPEIRWERARVQRPWEDKPQWRTVLKRRGLENGVLGRFELYRGHLIENAAQGTANRCLRHWMQPFDDVVLQVHDEAIREIPVGVVESEVKKTDEIFSSAPPWAMGLPLEAEITVSRRYGK